MDHNQTFFLNNIRTALGEAPHSERLKSMYPKLFNSPATTEIRQKHPAKNCGGTRPVSKNFAGKRQQFKHMQPYCRLLCRSADIVVELIRSKEPEFNYTKHVIGHDHPDIAALQLWNRFNREAVTVHTTFSSDGQIKEKTIASFIGITAPNIGVADSATLDPADRTRTTALDISSPLDPYCHSEKREYRRRSAGSLCPAARQSPLDSMVFISGPSKTADIEAHMVHGAHGPREVHLVIVAEPSPAESNAAITEES